MANLLYKSATVLVLGFTLAGCGPKYSPPDAPATACRAISKTQFDAAIASGATRATAKISEGGVVSMNTGAGVKHCSSFKGSKQICRRPNDFVIQYTLPNDQIRFVIVPKDSEYRLTMNRKPIPCEVVTP